MNVYDSTLIYLRYCSLLPFNPLFYLYTSASPSNPLNHNAPTQITTCIRGIHAVQYRDDNDMRVAYGKLVTKICPLSLRG
uniref:Uncharacterized protein n=1 Tax=Arundo donax TaxID=35708 RepID=A0A0A9H243_ARUDO